MSTTRSICYGPPYHRLFDTSILKLNCITNTGFGSSRQENICNFAPHTPLYIEADPSGIPCRYQIRADALSRQHGFNNALRILLCRPYLDDLKSDRLEQTTPLLFGPLHRCQCTHHVHIDMSHEGTGTSTRHHKLVNQDLGISLCHSFTSMAQDLSVLVVRPVVHDAAEIVYACP